MINMYIIYKNWPQTEKFELHSAYFSEDEASRPRDHSGPRHHKNNEGYASSPRRV